MSGAHLSKDFFELVRAIGESKSKQEEDRIVTKEVTVLKSKFQERGLSKAKLKECLVRLIYVEMLGHDGSFAYVHAIQLTASGNVLQKRVGYLCAALTLSPEHEFRFMLVNQLQRDLDSSNILEVSTALVAVCKLITEEMIPAVLPSVSKLLKHEKSLVRKKAALALERMYTLNPQSIAHLTQDFRNLLCDKDPSVMAASLCLLHDLAKANPQANKDLAPSYVTILKQITDHNIPADYAYHHVPAPWIQIKLLQILAVLGQNDKRVSEGMYDVLHECLRRAKNIISPVKFAVIYEFVRTVTSIYPNTTLLDAAAEEISQFIKSGSHNLKYLGVTGLAAIVRDNPRYAANHQLVVLDCLEDPDETLKRKTLDLLFRMTNPINAQVIVEKLLQFLRKTMDKFLRKDLVRRISELAERYSPSNMWYVRTMTSMFETSGDLVEAEVAQNLLHLLAEGEEGDEAASDEMRKEACEMFYELFAKPVLPEVLLKVMFWTLGEYGYLLGEEELAELIEATAEGCDREDIGSDTKGYAITALMKMCARFGSVPDNAASVVKKNCSSVGVNLQQRSKEFLRATENMEVLQDLLPLPTSEADTSAEDMSFLEDFARAQLEQGAADYNSEGAKDDEEEEEEEDPDDAYSREKASLRYDAYEKPTLPQATNLQSSLNRGPAFDDSTAAMPKEVGASASEAMPRSTGRRVKNVWGASGYKGDLRQAEPKPTIPTQQTPTYPPTPAAAATATSVPTAYAVEDSYSAPKEPTPSAVESRVPAAEPVKSKEQLERERMAAALFGGVATQEAVKTRTTGISRRTRRKGVEREEKEKASAAEEEIDLLGLDVLSAPTQSNGNAAGFEDGMDLLSSLDPIISTETKPFAGQVERREVEPLVLNTQEFGQQWVTLSSEERLSLANKPNVDFSGFVAALRGEVGLHVVEVIPGTQEAICAAKVGGASAFLHAKQKPSFSPPTVDLMVRAADPAVTAKLKSLLTATLG